MLRDGTHSGDGLLSVDIGGLVENVQFYGMTLVLLFRNYRYLQIFEDISNSFTDICNSITDICNSIMDISKRISDIFNSITDICNSLNYGYL